MSTTATRWNSEGATSFLFSKEVDGTSSGCSKNCSTVNAPISLQPLSICLPRCWSSTGFVQLGNSQQIVRFDNSFVTTGEMAWKLLMASSCSSWHEGAFSYTAVTFPQHANTTGVTNWRLACQLNWLIYHSLANWALQIREGERARGWCEEAFDWEGEYALQRGAINCTDVAYHWSWTASYVFMFAWSPPFAFSLKWVHTLHTLQEPSVCSLQEPSVCCSNEKGWR